MEARSSALARRQSWFGAKRHVKRLLAMRVPHALLRATVRAWPRLRAGGRLPAPARLGEVEGEAGGSRFTMLRPDRCIIAKELYWGGGHRPRPEDHLALELFAAAARRSDLVIDVGTYTGLFTIVAARINPALEAHAFELVPENYRALFDNCVRNDILDRVTLHHCGVGERGRRMRVPARSSGSALPDFYSSAQRFESGVRVGFTSLDALAERLRPEARVTVKVDVEGTEVEVFRHGQRFLETFRPRILCEVLPGAGGRELERLLEPYGYGFHLVRERDLLRSARISPDEGYRDWLFVAGDDDPAPAALGAPVKTRGADPAPTSAAPGPG